MDILSKSPVLSLPPFGPSSNGIETERDLDRLGRYGNDARESTSFSASMDLSPDHMEWVMNSFSSGESGFPLEWSPVSYDQIATSPMSTNLSDTGFPGSVEGIGDQFHQMATNNRSRTGSVNDPTESSQHQQVFDPNPLYQGTVLNFCCVSKNLTYPSAQSMSSTLSSSSQSVGWTYTGVPPLNFQNDSLWDEPTSASTYNTQTSFDPWPLENPPRYRASSGPDAPVFNQHTDLLSVHNQEVGSWTSSPALNPVATPSSSHSPTFSTAMLNQLSQSPKPLGSRTAIHLHLESTPRAPQASAYTRRPSSVVINQDQPFPKTTQPSDLNSEPSRSSPVTDFVFVQSPAQISSSRSNIDQKPVVSQLDEDSKTEFTSENPMSRLKQPQTPIFVQQHFPANNSSDTRITTESVRRTLGITKRGGRAVGSHLSSEGAARAKKLREEGSCWLCCLQRDSCTPGKVCDRCIKRNQRATLEHGLGCDRTKLTELKPFFTPAVITRIHEPHVLKEFCALHIKRWSGVSIKLKFNVIWTLPALECEVYEFEPKTPELLRQFQYFVDPDTRRLSRVEKVSPPLAMVQIEHEDRQKYDKYVSMIVEKHLDKFAERLYDIESEDFPTRLYRLMVRFHPDNKEEASLLREIHRLLVCTYIMCRTATIPNSQKHLLYKLHTYPSSPDAYAHAPSPRMANRQLKYLFCHLHQHILDSILKKLQQVLRSSKGPQKWTSAFIALLGLAMAFELTQHLVHVVTDADAAMQKYTPRDAEYVAESACRAIDEKFAFVSNLFRWKYRGFNPLRDMDRDQVKQVLGDKGVEFVRDVATLIAEKREYLLRRSGIPGLNEGTDEIFLFERQFVGISTENQDKYTSRLVARFFASFLSPQ